MSDAVVVALITSATSLVVAILAMFGTLLHRRDVGRFSVQLNGRTTELIWAETAKAYQHGLIDGQDKERDRDATETAVEVENDSPQSRSVDRDRVDADHTKSATVHGERSGNGNRSATDSQYGIATDHESGDQYDGQDD